MSIATCLVFAFIAGLSALPVGAVPSKTPASTWHTDGVVWAVERVGNAIILGGEFGELRSDDGRTMARANLAALDATTGEPLAWQADADGAVLALEGSPDGATVYIGGDFQSVAGLKRNRLAAVNVSNASVGPMNHAAAGRVRGLHAAGGKLFVAGEFDALGGLGRARVGAIDLASGAVDSTFSPMVQGGSVRDIDTSPDGTRLYLAGTFTSVAAAPGTSYVAAVQTSDGTAIDWDAGLDQPLFDVLAAGGEVYLAVGGVGWDNNRLQQHSAATANELNRYIADGDIQELELRGNVLYVGGHFVQLFGGVPRFQLAAIDIRDGEVLGFNPNIETKYGVWDIASGPEGLWIAGEFTRVSGATRGGIALLPGATASLPNDEALVQRSHWWKYFDLGLVPTTGTTWTTVGYDDNTWSSARPKLGYGTAAVNRTTAKVQTLYARRSFEVAKPADFASLEIRHLADDGAVIYLNGAEVVRDNLPAGPLAYGARARSSRFSELDTHAYRVSTVDVGNLVAGTNVIAVAVHNASPDSDDLRFGLELLARRGAAAPPPIGPPATCTTSATGQDVSVSWASVDSAVRYIVYRNPDNTSDFKAGETAAPGTTLLDTGVRTNATFIYRVIAIDDAGNRSTKRECSPPVNTAVAPNQGIQAPASCSVFVAGGEVAVDWPVVADADKYYVYRSRDGAGDSWVGKAVAPTSEFTDTKAWVGPSFSYLVASVDVRGTKSTKRACSPTSVSLDGAPPPAPITAPATCTVSVAGSDVTVSWGAVAGASRYTVYRNPDGVADYWVGTDTGTTILDAGVRSGPEFTYKVIAIDGAGVKSDKRTCGPTVQVGANPPPPPTGIESPSSCATTKADQDITVTWNPVADADKYYVYRSVDGAADVWAAKAVPPVVSHVDANRAPGDYTHRVVAVDSKGKKSDLTTCAPSQTIAAGSTPAPASCSAVLSGLDVNITWDTVAGVDRYTVFRNVSGGGDKWLATERTTSRVDRVPPTSENLLYKVIAITRDGSKSVKTTCSPVVNIDVPREPCFGLETEFFSRTDYRTSIGSFGLGDHVFPANDQDTASSLRVPAGLRVETYDFNDFRGSFGAIGNDVSNLGALGINDDIEAIRVTCVQ